MNWLGAEDLGAIYGEPRPAALHKVADRVTPDYARHIEAARFCALASVGPQGVDVSPRGDDGPVVRIMDPRHLALPDWQGNQRIDSIRNIVADGRVGLMFMIRGSGNVIRVRGRARLTDDAALRQSFARNGTLPRTVIVTQVECVYFQCARAVMRSGLWDGSDDSTDLPTPGQILARMTGNEVGGAGYDVEWPLRAAGTMW